MRSPQRERSYLSLAVREGLSEGAALQRRLEQQEASKESSAWEKLFQAERTANAKALSLVVIGFI